MKDLVLPIVILVIMGFVCANLAKKKHRNPKVWFMLGVVFCPISLLILFILPAAKSKSGEGKEHGQPDQSEQQEQQQLARAVNAQAVTAQDLIPEARDTNTLEARTWYYLSKSSKQVGPISYEELKQAKETGKVDDKSFLWTEGMCDWKTLNQLTYLKTEMIDEEKPTN